MGKEFSVQEVSAGYSVDEELVPEGYKVSELGLIPICWQVVELSQIVDLLSGHHVLAENCNVVGQGLPYLTGPADFPDGKIAHTKFTVKPTTLCAKHDILITVKGSGAGTMVEADAEYCISRQLMAIRVKAASHRFIHYYLLQNAGVISEASSGLIPGLSRKDIYSLKISLPNISEQTAIANALSDVDALINSLEKLIAKKQAIKTAAMQELLTGRVRLTNGELRIENGELKNSDRSQFSTVNSQFKKGYKQSELGVIPEDWKIVALCEVSHFINGRAYSIHEWEAQGIPVIRLQNLTGRGDEYYYSNLPLPDKQYCNFGDLLFMWSATFGPVIWKGDRAIFHYHIWKIECKAGFDKDFLFYLLDDMTEKLKQSSSSGGTMLHVTKEKMESTKVVVPDYEEQVAIAAVLSDVDTGIRALQQRLNKTKQIKQGMMQELLTGRVRLVNG